MKHLISISSVLISFTLLYSCKKDKDVEPITPPIASTSYDNYACLNVGNYWIYQLYNTDSLDNATPTSGYDSCYVEKDTLINANTYYKYVIVSPLYPEMSIHFLRDSLSYVVNERGVIYFSSTDFTNTFNLHYGLGGSGPPFDTVYVRSSKMINETALAIVPAGSFNVLNFKTSYIMYYPYSGGGYRRYQNARYAKDIGLISETLLFFVASPSLVERRLVRYHLN